MEFGDILDQVGKMTKLLVSWLSLWSLATIAESWIVDFNNPVVHTQYGSIRGRIDERKSKFNRRPICSFISIPFARPPIGSNRFQVSRRSRDFEEIAATNVSNYSDAAAC